MVVGEESFIKMDTYTTDLDEHLMEFNWEGQLYRLYGAMGSDLKKVKLSPRRKTHEIHTCIQQWKQVKYAPNKLKGSYSTNMSKDFKI